MGNNARGTLKAVDFFCGGGGMSYWMMKAWIHVLAGIDNEVKCKATYEANIKGAKFIHADVFNLKAEDLGTELWIEKKDDDLVLIGCSPCQYWSIINTNRQKSQKSKDLLKEFRRFVEYFEPGYVVVENVPWVLKKKGESGLEDFIEWLKLNKYRVHFGIHNANDFWVPQNRKRFTLIANRITDVELSPVPVKWKKPNVRDYIWIWNGFSEIEAGHTDDSQFLHTAVNLSDRNKLRLKYVEKNGWNRFGFANVSGLQLTCFEWKDSSFRDTYWRLWWDKPSPTITTKFTSISNGRFAHPEENRGLSLREGATLQSFPKKYEFICDSIGDIARIIGNAVCPKYSQRIGLAIKNNHDEPI